MWRGSVANVALFNRRRGLPDEPPEKIPRVTFRATLGGFYAAIAYCRAGATTRIDGNAITLASFRFAFRFGLRLTTVAIVGTSSPPLFSNVETKSGPPKCKGQLCSQLPALARSSGAVPLHSGGPVGIRTRVHLSSHGALTCVLFVADYCAHPVVSLIAIVISWRTTNFGA